MIKKINGCRKEEDRIKQLNARYAPENVINVKDKRKGPRSDPATRMTRHDPGRDTDLSNYTDGNRRRRPVSRSPTPERTPDPPVHDHHLDSSPKGPPPAVPLKHMTLAEKKRLEWERERGMFDDWLAYWSLAVHYCEREMVAVPLSVFLRSSKLMLHLLPTPKNMHHLKELGLRLLFSIIENYNTSSEVLNFFACDI